MLIIIMMMMMMMIMMLMDDDDHDDDGGDGDEAGDIEMVMRSMMRMVAIIGIISNNTMASLISSKSSSIN